MTNHSTDPGCALVRTPWQGNVSVHRPRLSRLRVTDPAPVYTYRQHGRTRVSREPMLRVEFWWNEGRETGVASVRDLAAVGIACCAITMPERRIGSVRLSGVH